MKTLTKENFLKFLVKHKACKRGLDWARSQESARDIVEKCPNIGHLRWLIEAIGGPMEAEYEEKIDPIWAEYEEKTAPLRAEYREKADALRAEHLDKLNMPWIEHLEQRDLLRVEYYEKEAPFRAEYEEKADVAVRVICTFERVQAEIGA